MEELYKKIQELRDLVKAVLPQPSVHKVPSLPKINPPAQPSMTATSTQSKIPGINPDSKKDPKKIAEQIKSGALRKQPAMIKADSNGQWYLDEPVEKGIKSAIAGAAIAGSALMGVGKASATPVKAPTQVTYETLDHGNGEKSTLNDRVYGPYTVTSMLQPRSSIGSSGESKSSELTHRVTLTGKAHSPEHAKALAAELKGSGIDYAQIMGIKAGDDLMSNKSFQSQRPVKK